MTYKPFVSVIIPTYNSASLLKMALESVIKQTYHNWEVIIIDNSSTDETDEVIQSFNDIRIRVLKIYNSGVIAKSRNLGLDSSKGEWIAFLDSDDLWYENKLEISVYKVLQDPRIDVCSTNELQVDHEKKFFFELRYGPFDNNFYKTLIKYGNRLSTSATMVRKDFLVKHKIIFRENSEFVTAEDFDFWLQLAQKNAFFFFVQSIQGEYTIHPGNESKKLNLHLINTENILLDHVFNQQNFTQKKLHLWNCIKSRLIFEEARRAVANDQYFLAIKLAIKAFYKSPVHCFKIAVKIFLIHLK